MEPVKSEILFNIKELILFNIDAMLCGISNYHAKEINKNFNLTVVPHSPKHVRGVINLRGNIVTVIDLRRIFGFESSKISEEMHIIIVSYKDENLGLLVDNVSDVIQIDQKKLEESPANISGVSSNFFLGVYKTEEELIAILNTEKILDIKE